MANIGAENGGAALNAVVRGPILAPDRLESYFNLLGSLNIWSEGEGKNTQFRVEQQRLAVKKLDIPFGVDALV